MEKWLARLTSFTTKRHNTFRHLFHSHPNQSHAPIQSNNKQNIRLTMARFASHLIPAKFRSDEKRKANKSRQVLREFQTNTNRTADRCSSSYMDLIPSSIVKKYLKKDAASSKPAAQANRKRSTTALRPSPVHAIDENGLHKTKTSHNLQELLRYM